jgi:hypothetical protein
VQRNALRPLGIFHEPPVVRPPPLCLRDIRGEHCTRQQLHGLAALPIQVDAPFCREGRVYVLRAPQRQEVYAGRDCLFEFKAREVTVQIPGKM